MSTPRGTGAGKALPAAKSSSKAWARARSQAGARPAKSKSDTEDGRGGTEMKPLRRGSGAGGEGGKACTSPERGCQACAEAQQRIEYYEHRLRAFERAFAAVGDEMNALERARRGWVHEKVAPEDLPRIFREIQFGRLGRRDVRLWFAQDASRGSIAVDSYWATSHVALERCGPGDPNRYTARDAREARGAGLLGPFSADQLGQAALEVVEWERDPMAVLRALHARAGESGGGEGGNSVE